MARHADNARPARHARTLRSEHVGELRAALGQGELSRLWYTNVPAPAQAESYVEAALRMQAEGMALPFVVRNAAGHVVGSTRYYDLAADVPRLSIGYTWYAPSVQRTGLNTETKLMLLEHEFARSVVDAAADGLGDAIGGAVNVLDPSCVVLGGGMAVEGTRWWARVTAAVARQLLLPAEQHPVVPAALGGHAALRRCRDRGRTHRGGAGRTEESHMIPPIIESLRGTLVVSCQAYPGEPMRDSRTMTQVALAAEEGGASAIRAAGLDDLAAMSAVLGVPLIGLVKEGDEPVFITPTVRVCLGGGARRCDDRRTGRDPPPETGWGRRSSSAVAALRDETDALVLGDIGSAEDARYAIDCGVDAVATTLSGYTGSARPTARTSRWWGSWQGWPYRCWRRGASRRPSRPARPSMRVRARDRRDGDHPPDLVDPAVRGGAALARTLGALDQVARHLREPGHACRAPRPRAARPG